MTLRENVFSVLNPGEIQVSLYSPSFAYSSTSTRLWHEGSVSCPLLCHWCMFPTEHLLCVLHRSTFLSLRNVPFSSQANPNCCNTIHCHRPSAHTVNPQWSFPTFRSGQGDCLLHTATACPHREPKHDKFCSWYYRSVSAACAQPVPRLASRVNSLSRPNADCFPLSQTTSGSAMLVSSDTAICCWLVYVAHCLPVPLTPPPPTPRMLFLVLVLFCFKPFYGSYGSSNQPRQT